ncbi:hypothetical protein IJH27_00460 [Candidatus Saccharibacteria bacterium]|nr:hypothetical protein [Candidatus Saccharibacteria bacterium]
MVCIAAFIILGLIGVFVAIISIFKREIGRAYLKVFKKSWGCVGKKIRLQKCDTNFKDDVKNALLKKVILRAPALVKPLSIIIEVGSILIVFVFVWAVLTSIKSLLALWSLGTCNIDQPAACTLSSEACSLGDDTANKTLLEKTGRWFTEWGDIFAAFPDRFKSWHADEFFVEPTVIVDTSILDQDKNPLDEDKPYALDIVDPGCSACMMSYRNQLSSGFFETHQTALLVYPIEIEENNYKFTNSGLVARYFYAAALLENGEVFENKGNYSLRLIHKIFTEKTEDGVILQSHINSLSSEDAEAELKSWLKEFGADKTTREKIAELSRSAEVDEILSKVKDVVQNKVHIKGIPTLLYDNKKHLGLYETE